MFVNKTRTLFSRLPRTDDLITENIQNNTTYGLLNYKMNKGVRDKFSRFYKAMTIHW